jgi:glyoxylase-like metal-dependent hydrolase (beta-lactamase superfamily II)
MFGVGHDSNIFLVTGENPVLVDAGTGMHTRKVLEGLARVAPDCMPKTIVLTHRHFDHVGGAHELSVHFGAEVVMHEKDAQSIEDGDARSTAASMFGCQLKPVKVRRVKEGDVLSTGDHDMQVLHTPGHTIGSMCLFEGSSGILISGDTVFASGVGRWDLPTGNRADLERSVKMLLSKEPKHLFPGHGDILQDRAMESIEESLIMLGEF